MTPLQMFLLIILSGALVFAVYFIINFFTKRTQTSEIQETMESMPYRASLENENSHAIPDKVSDTMSSYQDSQPAQIREQVVEVAKTPEIPGTSEEQLAEQQPLQRKVSQKVDSPSNYDVYETNENQAMFGSNLRHPEAMITKVDNYSTLETDVASGIASRVEAPSEVTFNTEMISNGAEFMKGINAFDTSEAKSWFSSF
jgi:hypothetical protein